MCDVPGMVKGGKGIGWFSLIGENELTKKEKSLRVMCKAVPLTVGVDKDAYWSPVGSV